MNKNRLYFLVGFWLLLVLQVSCIQLPKPQTQLPNDQLAAAVRDLIILQHGINSLPQNLFNRDSIRCEYRRRIFMKYGIDSAALVRDIEAWYAHPVLMDTFYAQVLQQLQIEQVREEMVRIPKKDHQ